MFLTMIKYILILTIILKNVHSHRRIFQGTFASPGQFPYMASLRNKNDMAHNCGAALITSRWVITAAHCLFPVESASVVVVGSVYREKGTNYDTEAVIPHPDYINEAMQYQNDIGLVKTMNEIIFGQYVQPIKIAQDYIGAGVSALVAGWGRNMPKGNGSKRLMYVNFTTITNDACIENFPKAEIVPSMLCVVADKGKGTCAGDSGGPLTVDGELVGIVNFQEGCAFDAPEVYARISSFKSWLEENIG